MQVKDNRFKKLVGGVAPKTRWTPEKRPDRQELYKKTKRDAHKSIAEGVFDCTEWSAGNDDLTKPTIQQQKGIKEDSAVYGTG